MEFIHEYALLVAVATPVLVIVGLQVYLFVAGERGTLLLPSLKPFPAIAIEAPRAEAASVIEARTVFEASERDERLAA
ncbi:MAG TPA: hypothetical protein VGI57_04340 [Usitatibacter sp.]